MFTDSHFPPLITSDPTATGEKDVSRLETGGEARQRSLASSSALYGRSNRGATPIRRMTAASMDGILSRLAPPTRPDATERDDDAGGGVASEG